MARIKRWFLLLALTTLLATTAAVPAAQAQVEVMVGSSCEITAATLNVRQEASTNSVVVAQLKRGNNVAVIAVSGNWVKHAKGWSYSSGYMNCGNNEQAGAYTLAWFRDIAARPDGIDLFNAAWESSDGWKSGEAKKGCFQVPAHTAVIGSFTAAGSTFNIEHLGNLFHYLDGGGAYCSPEGYRAMQLEGAGRSDTPAERPDSLDALIGYVTSISEYEVMIGALDLEWSGSPYPINRWGSHGPRIWNEAYEGEPLCQLLPGDSIVWGALAEGNFHWGLKMVAENVYVTTGDGGQFCTYWGYRSMQYPKASVAPAK